MLCLPPCLLPKLKVVRHSSWSISKGTALFTVALFFVWFAGRPARNYEVIYHELGFSWLPCVPEDLEAFSW